jgi:NADH:ubiquinone oxidoreductase subunit 3 (subunit A)
MDQTDCSTSSGSRSPSIFVFGTILFSWLITHRRRTPQKGLPYECGIGDRQLVALRPRLLPVRAPFVAFDVEIVFVTCGPSWSAIAVQGIVMIRSSWGSCFGELYAWRKGDLWR